MKSYEQIKQEQASELMRLIKFAGSQSRLARALDVSPQVVQNWVKRGRISATAAIEAEEQTNGFITKEDLRPDVDSWLTEQ
jgi:DNA-binding transcriptional regulator YdaS (Cro superfamily)